MKIISDIKGKNVIVSPLDWGLGHASRIIPVIKILQKNSCTVTVVCGKGGYALMKAELPDTEIIMLKEKRIKYPKGKIGLISFLRWIFVMGFNTVNEKIKIGKTARQKHTQIIISDNRYGLCFKNLDCYIITHQIAPRVPWKSNFLQKLSDKIFKKELSKFKKVLIPDFEEGFSLTGPLAADLASGNEKYEKIGILSRFSNSEDENQTFEYDYLILISGQEKQRTVFENLLLKQIKNTDKKIIFVRGITDKNAPKLENFANVVFYNSLTGNDLEFAFKSSRTVVCRAGYSTICDFLALKKNAVIIPTPGQTEQEFLAERLNGKFGIIAVNQDVLQKNVNF